MIFYSFIRNVFPIRVSILCACKIAIPVLMLNKPMQSRGKFFGRFPIISVVSMGWRVGAGEGGRVKYTGREDISRQNGKERNIQRSLQIYRLQAKKRWGYELSVTSVYSPSRRSRHAYSQLHYVKYDHFCVCTCNNNSHLSFSLSLAPARQNVEKTKEGKKKSLLRGSASAFERIFSIV